MTARITSGFYDYLIVEADCPICGKPTATDCGKNNRFYDKHPSIDVEFYCPDCENSPEFGVTLTVAITPMKPKERK